MFFAAYKTAKGILKIIFAVIILIIIILLAVGLGLLANKKTSGIWVMGAGVGLAAFTVWYVRLKAEKVE